MGDLTWVKGSYISVSGEIISQWERDGSTLSMRMEIPANAGATVYVPAQNRSSVREGGQSADEAPGVTFLRMEGNTAVFEVRSGRYTFTTELPAAM